MKSILLFTIFIILASICVNAQQKNDKYPLTKASLRSSFYASMNSGNFSDSSTLKAEYLKKSKNQKTAAWAMLAGGIAMASVGGILVYANFDLYTQNTAADVGGVLFVIGACSALGSIPFFISSSHNAKKAASISFKNQELFLPHGNPLYVKSQPAITLKIKIN
jgi:hypothetical protein